MFSKLFSLHKLLFFFLFVSSISAWGKNENCSHFNRKNLILSHADQSKNFLDQSLKSDTYVSYFSEHQMQNILHEYQQFEEIYELGRIMICKKILPSSDEFKKFINNYSTSFKISYFTKNSIEINDPNLNQKYYLVFEAASYGTMNRGFTVIVNYGEIYSIFFEPDSDICFPFQVKKIFYNDDKTLKLKIENSTALFSDIVLETLYLNKPSFLIDNESQLNQGEDQKKRILEKRINLIDSDTGTIQFITGRKYSECLERLSMNFISFKKEDKVLSVGEGTSDFIAKLVEQGIDAWSVDASIKNPYAPGRSKLGFSQKLPFEDESFNYTVSIWLLPHFFNKRTINNPEVGIQSLQEMVRVTKIGGQIRINPIEEVIGGRKIIQFFEELRQKDKVNFFIIKNKKRDKSQSQKSALIVIKLK